MKNLEKIKKKVSPFVHNMIILMKNMFSKLLPKVESFSKSSLSYVNSWKKRQSPWLMKYLHKLLSLIKKIKDSIGPTIIRIYNVIKTK